MNDLIFAKLKNTVDLQDVIKQDDLNNKSKRRRTYDFNKYSVSVGFFRRYA